MMGFQQFEQIELHTKKKEEKDSWSQQTMYASCIALYWINEKTKELITA
jgi:hypothetical protein